MRMRLRRAWLWPVLGGYAASLSLFNLVEPINQVYILVAVVVGVGVGVVINQAHSTDDGGPDCWYTRTQQYTSMITPSHSDPHPALLPHLAFNGPVT